MPGRDQSLEAFRFAREAMVGFRIVARIGQHATDSGPPGGLFQQVVESVDIGPWSLAGLEGQNEVIARVANQPQFGEVVVRHRFPR